MVLVKLQIEVLLNTTEQDKYKLENTRYTGALFDTPHTPPTLPAFDFKISYRLDQPSKKLLTGSPAASPPHTHSHPLVGAIESPRPL